MNAEQAYLFRHALLREAAYALQIPSDRQLLHGHAFELLMQIADDAMALDIAQHAKNGPARLAKAELDWLARAESYLESTYQLREAAGVAMRMAHHPLADTSSAASSLALAGRLFGQCDLMTEAQGAFARAIETASQAGLHTLIMRCKQGLSNVRRTQGKLDEALALTEEVIEYARVVSDRELLVLSLGTKAHTLVEAGMNEAACRTADLALESLPPGTNDRLRGQLLGNKCTPLIGLGLLAEAESAARESLSAAIASKSLPNEGYALCNLGNIAIQQGKSEEAQACLQRALAIASETGDQRLAAYSLQQTSHLLWTLNRRVEALSPALHAIHKYRELNMQAAHQAFLNRFVREAMEDGLLACAEEAAEQVLAAGHTSTDNLVFALTIQCRARRLLQNRAGAVAAATRLRQLASSWERDTNRAWIESALDATGNETGAGFQPESLSAGEKLAALDVMLSRGIPLDASLRARFLQGTPGTETPDWNYTLSDLLTSAAGRPL